MPELEPDASGATPAIGSASTRADAILRRLVMEDILDEAILAARPHDREFPLRILFGQLGESLDDDAGFVLASGLSFYFRVPTDDETRVRYRLNVGLAAKLSVQAIERLLPIVGGRGHELADPFQRAWRDAHAVAQHIALTWDLQALNYGAVRLGGKAGDTRI
jgi:hypothetical protein